METRSKTKKPPPPTRLNFYCDEDLLGGVRNEETGADIVLKNGDNEEYIDWESWRTRTGPLFVEAFTRLRDENVFQIVKVDSVIKEKRPEILKMIIALGYDVQFEY